MATQKEKLCCCPCAWVGFGGGMSGTETPIGRERRRERQRRGAAAAQRRSCGGGGRRHKGGDVGTLCGRGGVFERFETGGTFNLKGQRPCVTVCDGVSHRVLTVVGWVGCVPTHKCVLFFVGGDTRVCG